jgi:hypothetical protein
MNCFIKPITEPSEKVCNLKNQSIDINEFHIKMGHPAEAKLRDTALRMKIHLTGTLTSCVNCHLGKARRKKLKKKDNNKTQKPFERVYIDLEPISSSSQGGKKNWFW